MGDVVQLRQPRASRAKSRAVGGLSRRVNVQLTVAQVEALKVAVKWRANSLDCDAILYSCRSEDGKARVLRREVEELDAVAALLAEVTRG